jgi:hypothetical protein
MFSIQHYNFAKEKYEHYCTMVDIDEAKKVACELSRLDNLEKYYDDDPTPIEDCSRLYQVLELMQKNSDFGTTIIAEYHGGIEKRKF